MIFKNISLWNRALLAACTFLFLPFMGQTAVHAEILPPPAWTINPANFQFRMDMVIRIRYDNIPSNDPGNIIGVFVGPELRGVATPVNIGGELYFFTTIYSNIYTGETIRFRAYYAPDDQVYGSPDMFTFTNYGIIGSIADPFWIDIDPNFDFPPEIFPILADTTIQTIPFEPKGLAGHLVSQDGDPVTWSALPGSNLTATIVNDSLFVDAVSPAWAGTDSVRIIATENTPGQLADTIYALFTVLPDYGAPMWGTVPGQTIFGGGSFTPFDLDDYLTFNGPCRAFDLIASPLVGSDPDPNWPSVAPAPPPMTIVARPMFLDMPLAGAGAQLAAFVNGVIAATAAPSGTLPDVSYTLQLQDVGAGAISFAFYHAENQYLYEVNSGLNFSAGSTVGTLASPHLIQLSPITPVLDANGGVQLQINDADWRGDFPIDFIVWDCDYPAQRRDTTTAVFSIQDDNYPKITSSTTVNYQENACYDLYDTQSVDPNDSEGNGLTYDISGGPDAALFSIDPVTGALSWFNFTPNTGIPGDANTDNMYELTIRVTNQLNLTDEINLVVTVTQDPDGPFNPQLTGGNGLCIAGGAATLQASGGSTYLWSTGATTASIMVTNADLYFVTITDDAACSAVLSIPLSVAPSITAGGNTGIVCVGSDIVLTSAPSGGSGMYTMFSWSGPDGFSASVQNPPAFTATSAFSGIYSVMVTDGAGCTATATATVNVSANSAPTITATGTSTVCVGQSIDLNSSASGGTTPYTQYRWTGPNTYASNVMNPQAFTATTPAAGGVYTVTVTDSQGCTATSTASVTVNPLPDITAAGNGPLCVGATAVLSSTPSGGSGVYTSFAWTGPDNFMSSVEDPASFQSTLDDSGLYSVVVTDNAGCSATGSVNLSVTGNPGISAMAVGPTCEGGMLTLASTPSGGSGVYSSFVWTGPNGFMSSLEDPAPIPATGAGGAYQVIVTDNAGCTATASTNITIHPVPSITAQSNSPVCENANLQLTSAPSGGSGVFSLFNWSGPDDYVASTEDPVGFSTTLASAGVYQVKLTDSNGCTATTTTTAVIVPKPVATASNNGPACQGTLVDLMVSVTGGSGTFSSFSWTGPGGYTANQQNPAAFPAMLDDAGIYRVTVTDNVGCTSTSSTTLAVSSNFAPTVTAGSNSPLCLGATLQLTSNPTGGTGTYQYAWSGPDTYSASVKNPTRPNALASHSGTYTVTVTDGNACKNTASATVQISEVVVTAGNTGTCLDPTIVLNSSATGGSGVYVSYSWTGPDGYMSNLQNPVPIPRVPTAEGIYTVIVTDNQGCTGSDTTFVQVTDTNPPTISCPGMAQTVVAGPSCSSALGTWTGLATGLSDDCSAPGDIAVTQSPASNTLLTGHNTVQTVTLTATDESNNSASCTLTVVLKDQAPPTIQCPADQTVAADANCSSTVGAWVLISKSDNCTAPASIAEMQSPASSTALNGHNDSRVVTLTADDGNGNTQQCTFNVTLKDITPPVVQCPADQTLSADANCSSEIGDWDFVSAEDNCAAMVMRTQSPVPTTVLSGHNDARLVTLTGDDGNGNTTPCTFTVTLKDVTPPSITCPPNITVACSTDVPAENINLVQATDNCSPVTKTYLGFTIGQFTCLNRYVITRGYRAADDYGNSAMCTHTITVRDTIGPTFTAVPANVTVQCNAVPSVGNAFATDNCNGGATVVYSGQVRTDGNCLDSYILTRTWTATDICGNTSTATQRIVVRDTQKPVFTSIPANVTVQCDAIPDVGTPASVDNCDQSVDITYNGETRTNGACPDSYTLVRRWTATDNCGNTRTASQRITVRDTQKPIIADVPSNITLECNQALPSVGNPTATDNCDQSVTITYLGATPGLYTCEYTYPLYRRWMATDNCGNSTLATQTIFIQDTQAPTITGSPADMTLECSDPFPAIGTPTAVDNCGGSVQVIFLGEVRTDGACLYDYTLTRTWRVQDLCGNSVTVSQVIAIEDTEAPVFDNAPANITVSCGGVPPVPVVTATDNCGPALVSYLGQVQTPGDCNTGYVVTRLWMTTDLCSNLTMHMQTITVNPDMLEDPIQDRQRQADISEPHESSFRVLLAPNPAASSVYVRFHLDQEAEATVFVFDLSGRIVHTHQYMANQGENVYPMQLETLPGGVYLVQVRAGMQQAVEKLIVLER